MLRFLSSSSPSSVPNKSEPDNEDFKSLFSRAGMQAIKEIVPTLLHALEDDKPMILS
ncbi:hypothetical protein Dsin_028305 [Dipteronia sinensis]|uniref:Uncharacterized protein n=1 Tax=Dipteronia sinensis TaxID=43782 RepID=A0AAD9ZQV3_9ROSI|nr:hypothetical protein Dsin_028305 [Dipteronia sinensis]